MSDTRTLVISPELALALSTSGPQVADESLAWQCATVSTLAQVEDLLNQAERHGHREHELTVLGPNLFVVRWR